MALHSYARSVRRFYRNPLKTSYQIIEINHPVEPYNLIERNNHAFNLSVPWIDFNDGSTLVDGVSLPRPTDDALIDDAKVLEEIKSSIATRNFTKEIVQGISEGFLAELVSVILYESSQPYTVAETVHTSFKSVLVDMLTNFVTVAYPKIQQEVQVGSILNIVFVCNIAYIACTLACTESTGSH